MCAHLESAEGFPAGFGVVEESVDDVFGECPGEPACGKEQGCVEPGYTKVEVGDTQNEQGDREVDCPGHPDGRTEQFMDPWVFVEDAFALGTGTQFFGNAPTHCRVGFGEFLLLCLGSCFPSWNFLEKRIGVHGKFPVS